MAFRNSIFTDPYSDRPLLMIPRHGTRKSGKTFIDNLVKDVCAHSDIERSVSNHTFHKTCARMWYRAVVPLATISSLLGHADVKAIVKYLGLTMDDLNNEATLYHRYYLETSRQNSEYPKSGQKQSIAEQNGGLGEI